MGNVTYLQRYLWKITKHLKGTNSGVSFIDSGTHVFKGDSVVFATGTL